MSTQIEFIATAAVTIRANLSHRMQSGRLLCPGSLNAIAPVELCPIKRLVCVIIDLAVSPSRQSATAKLQVKPGARSANVIHIETPQSKERWQQND
jgi:hypothetical protein